MIGAEKIDKNVNNVQEKATHEQQNDRNGSN
jgi:hypothetical protein